MVKKLSVMVVILFTLMSITYGISNFLKNQIPAKIIGKAKLILKPLGVLKNEKEKDIYGFEILIDLRGVKTVRKDNGNSSPTVLGGYTVGISFDNKNIQFLGVKGGNTKEFRKPPFHTNNKKANENGLVKFSAVHTKQNSPTGLISVAIAKFKVKNKNSLKSIKLYGDSLATSMKFFPNKKILGPISIPFEGEKIKRKKLKNNPKTLEKGKKIKVK